MGWFESPGGIFDVRVGGVDLGGNVGGGKMGANLPGRCVSLGPEPVDFAREAKLTPQLAGREAKLTPTQPAVPPPKLPPTAHQKTKMDPMRWSGRLTFA